ncbi:class I SAM-dependent methyltransferase [Pseudodesulfovibrio sp.]|uniref:class I SAM-dependent methyltransferase n=1 Tax=Pseudodesulfovibrio sp. TaxID=2035812 RepID=UPI002632B65F|nr:class I SAM-dependent methyltransferase [Pseudodesulfovibrio sp.]MDD3313837.1 class I SAM-dependent methyltransferase [Pseudodesulfovibrio sp.]
MLNEEQQKRLNGIVDRRIANGNFRFEVAHFVEEGAANIMEYGFGDASLLLGLRRDKGCNGIYGIEINPVARDAVADLLDKTWLIDLNREDAWLEEEYEGFFNYILAPMSMEHTYDPWYVMKKFNKYLAPGGKLIVQTPNVQWWESIYRILTGDFPYVSGGTWDYTHIRWYTLKSLIDIAFVAGFSVKQYLPQFMGDYDLSHLQRKSEMNVLRLPPPECRLKLQPIDVVMPVDIKSIYPLFLAHAFVLCLEKTREPEDCEPTHAGCYLEKYRLITPNPLGSISSLISDPILPPLISRSYDMARELKREIEEKTAAMAG